MILPRRQFLQLACAAAALPAAKPLGANPPHMPLPPLLEPAYLIGAKSDSPALDWLFYGGLAAGASLLLGGIYLVAR